MLVYRISFSKYATSLKASGRAARWNPNETEVIYTSCSRSLACLENVVHRNQYGLSQLFNVMTIEIADSVKRKIINLADLPGDWREFNQMPFTQSVGENWLKENKAAVLQVPSSIVEEDVNYLLNPLHPDFKDIRLLKSEPFIFDKRIKL